MYFNFTETCSKFSKETLTLPCLAATPTLKGEEVGVIAITAQAKIWPPDSITFVRVQNKLPLCQLHNPRAQLIAFIINICHLYEHQKILSGAPGMMSNGSSER